jgi:signal transduction histidine kinase
MTPRLKIPRRKSRAKGRTLSVLALALVFATLLGSVLIPARLTWRIVGDLHRIAAADPAVITAIEEIRTLEEKSLIVNAALVLVALATVLSVVALTRRERRLARIVERRLAQESALREAAEALAQAFTIEDVTRQIVRTAIRASVARGAFVEHIISGTESPALAVVQATAGRGMPPLGASRPYADSYAARAIASGEPILVPDLVLPGADATTASGQRKLAAIVVPLAHRTAAIGALFLVHPARKVSARDRAGLAAAYTFSKLATLAYEKVRLLEEARAGRQQLDRAMKSRSRLMRGFSHDVKNPLGAASGYAELLSLGIHGQLTAEQNRIIGNIQRCIASALALIDDLHQLGRAETGNIVVQRATVDVVSLLKAVAEDYSGAAAAKGLSLTVEVEADRLLIESDRVRVREIIGNLLSNAIKYTQRGVVTLRLAKESPPSAAATSAWARIDVIDTGPGIAAEDHDAIFQEFSRLPSEQPGAGVGLAISTLVADALGGRISLVSDIDRGSTFTLWLPMTAAVAPDTPRQGMESTPGEAVRSH